MVCPFCGAETWGTFVHDSEVKAYLCGYITGQTQPEMCMRRQIVNLTAERDEARKELAQHRETLRIYRERERTRDELLLQDEEIMKALKQELADCKERLELWREFTVISVVSESPWQKSNTTDWMNLREALKAKGEIGGGE